MWRHRPTRPRIATFALVGAVVGFAVGGPLWFLIGACLGASAAFW